MVSPKESDTPPPLIESQVEGIFEPQPNKAGCLLQPVSYGRRRVRDPFIPRDLVRRYQLRRGQHIIAEAQQDPRYTNPKVCEIRLVDGRPPEERAEQPRFINLPALPPDPHPIRSFLRAQPDLEFFTEAEIELFRSVAGSASGIVGPRLIKKIQQTEPTWTVLLVLCDVMPEELAQWNKAVAAETWASISDSAPLAQWSVIELAFDRACCLAETGRDVVLFWHSPDRLRGLCRYLADSSFLYPGMDVPSHPEKNPPRLLRLFATHRITSSGSISLVILP